VKLYQDSEFGVGEYDSAGALRAGRIPEHQMILQPTHALTGEGFDASEDGTGRGTPLIPIDMRQASRGATMTNNRAEGSTGGAPGTGIGEDGDPAPTISTSHTPAICFDTTQMTSKANRSSPKHGDPCHPLAAGAHAPAIAFKSGQSEAAGGIFTTEEFSPTLQAQNNGSTAVPSVMSAMQVRRLTPEECEALQGFPRSYTAVPHRGKPAADGPRYKALGNSWAVPCARWIGERIEAAAAIQQLQEAA
jgi:DNA (cytosine-5)-methyltransferase 1